MTLSIDVGSYEYDICLPTDVSISHMCRERRDGTVVFHKLIFTNPNGFKFEWGFPASATINHDCHPHNDKYTECELSIIIPSSTPYEALYIYWKEGEAIGNNVMGVINEFVKV